MFLGPSPRRMSGRPTKPTRRTPTVGLRRTPTTTTTRRPPAAPGATVTLHGQFPYARFLSLSAYKNLNGEPGIPADSLSTKTSSRPRLGEPVHGRRTPQCEQPFLHDHDQRRSPACRTRRRTRCTPARRPHRRNPEVEVIERIYRADRDLEANGGVAVPTPSTTRPKAAGQRRRSADLQRPVGRQRRGIASTRRNSVSRRRIQSASLWTPWYQRTGDASGREPDSLGKVVQQRISGRAVLPRHSR